MKPNQSPSQVLQAARALVAAGWCQGPYYLERADGGFDFCAMGALFQASGTPLTDRTARARIGRWPINRVAEKALDRVVERETKGYYDGIVSYNEGRGRTKEEVLRMFDLALEEVTK